MNRLHCKLPDVIVTKPRGLSRRMFFHVYRGPNAIGFAHLSSRPSRKLQCFSANEFSTQQQQPSISYCLKNIEVSPNYRNQGIGTALLNEVINFCQDERISAIYGEAKGELEVLRRWYRGKGFTLDKADNIRLSI